MTTQNEYNKPKSANPLVLEQNQQAYISQKE
jgi:hypothetical protein